jgi:hypothetical protein
MRPMMHKKQIVSFSLLVICMCCKKPVKFLSGQRWRRSYDVGVEIPPLLGLRYCCPHWDLTDCFTMCHLPINNTAGSQQPKALCSLQRTDHRRHCWELLQNGNQHTTSPAECLHLANTLNIFLQSWH